MEICVNDYIRTDKGYIWKIDKIDECKYCGQKVCICKETIGDLHFKHTYHKGDITKHSKKIIDLIQCGDYVNGFQVINFCIDRDNFNEKCGVVVLCDEYHQGNTKRVEIDEFKSILTKEQYEQNSYKI